ncbi:MAG TPA: hypothetical protein VF748_14480 [Candidatus Acidoferrum sp.]
MRPDPKTLRWKCPHCDIGHMMLRSANKHLRKRHSDCVSCHLEQLLVQQLLAGNGWLTPIGSDPFSRSHG